MFYAGNMGHSSSIVRDISKQGEAQGGMGFFARAERLSVALTHHDTELPFALRCQRIRAHACDGPFLIGRNNN